MEKGRSEQMIKKVIPKRIPIVKYRNPVKQIPIDKKEIEKLNISVREKTKRRKEKNEARCGGVLGEMRKQKRC